jgi:hypothetical protein
VWPAAAQGSQAVDVAVVVVVVVVVGGVGGFHEQHCEAHSLLPQHEHSIAQAHPESSRQYACTPSVRDSLLH